MSGLKFLAYGLTTLTSSLPVACAGGEPACGESVYPMEAAAGALPAGRY